MALWATDGPLGDVTIVSVVEYQRPFTAADYQRQIIADEYQQPIVLIEHQRQIAIDEYQRPVVADDHQLQIVAVDFQRVFELTQEDPLHLAPEGVEFYALTITTDPAVNAAQWRASFDGGDTWYDAQVVDGRSAWLVAGYAAADPGAAVAVLTSSTAPLVQHADDPSVYVRYPPAITLH